jgi:paraquat-inducible protein B
MSKKASPTLIGFFTLIGLILAGLGAVFFGAGKYFETTYPVLLYFDKSANGLQVGSDVRFGGVRIGSVSSISVLVAPGESRKIIPVVVQLNERNLRLVNGEDGGGIDFSTREGVEAAVRDGLRAGMKQQSLVTGQLYIEFDILPDAESFVYVPRQEPPYPVVPTVGTQIDELIAGIADGLRMFNSLDLQGVMDDIRVVLSSAQQQIDALNMEEINENLVAITEDVRNITSDEKLASAVDNLNKALISIEEVASRANVGIDPLLADLKVVMQSTEASLEGVRKATEEISQMSSPRGPAMIQMQNVLRETQRATQSLQELSNELKRNPGTLLRGRALTE